MKPIDDFLNKITMYRLALYYLIAIILSAFFLSFFKLVPYDPVAIALSALFLVFFSGFINDFLAKIFSSPLNTESSIITALILAAIVKPVQSVSDFMFLGWVAVFAMTSKFLFSIKRKHIFNPAAIAVVITAFFLNRPAIWWVGNPYLFPVVFLGGFLIVRKTRKETMIYSFLATAIVSVLGFSLIKGSDLFAVLNNVILHSSLPFFAFAMVTEPLTMPTTENFQIIFALLVGFLFAPDIHIGSIYSTPELSLVIGNLFAYIISPKYKLLLYLKEKIKLTNDTYDFVFPLEKKLDFRPGQYMEWTLAHRGVDDRGNRRYFTIASSPTENHLRIGVKFYNPASTYKKNMSGLGRDLPIVASQLSGDFTLPSDTREKLVFIAGGIGITPFRSIIKYLVDRNEKRDIILFYSNRYFSEIIYQDVFNEAKNKLDIRIVYTLTDINSLPANWIGERGRINSDMIRKYVPDFYGRKFYLSGPRRMVDAFEDTLKTMNVGNDKIKTDFFPGFV